LDKITQRVLDEEARGLRLYGEYHNLHEAYAILLEEVDELWDDIKKNRRAHAVVEAIQVAAVALRIVREFTRYGD